MSPLLSPTPSPPPTPPSPTPYRSTWFSSSNSSASRSSRSSSSSWDSPNWRMRALPQTPRPSPPPSPTPYRSAWYSSRESSPAPPSPSRSVVSNSSSQRSWSYDNPPHFASPPASLCSEQRTELQVVKQPPPKKLTKRCSKTRRIAQPVETDEAYSTSLLPSAVSALPLEMPRPTARFWKVKGKANKVGKRVMALKPLRYNTFTDED